MKNLKTYSLFLESIASDDINDILQPLKDIGLKFNHQMQEDDNIIILYITPNKYKYKKDEIVRKGKFNLGEIRDEVNHLISQMKDDGYKLKKSMYLNHDKNGGVWRYLWDGIPHRSNPDMEVSSYDIFDVQDMDPSKEIVDSFELKFERIK